MEPKKLLKILVKNPKSSNPEPGIICDFLDFDIPFKKSQSPNIQEIMGFREKVPIIRGFKIPEKSHPKATHVHHYLVKNQQVPFSKALTKTDELHF